MILLHVMGETHHAHTLRLRLKQMHTQVLYVTGTLTPQAQSVPVCTCRQSVQAVQSKSKSECWCSPELHPTSSASTTAHLRLAMASHLTVFFSHKQPKEELPDWLQDWTQTVCVRSVSVYVVVILVCDSSDWLPDLPRTEVGVFSYCMYITQEKTV